jgi:hypothetical protein
MPAPSIFMFLLEALSPLTFAVDGTLAFLSPRHRARLLAQGGERRLIAGQVFGAVTWVALLAGAMVLVGRWLGVH